MRIRSFRSQALVSAPEATTPTLGDMIPQFIDRHAQRHTKDWKGTQTVLLRLKKLHGKQIN